MDKAKLIEYIRDKIKYNRDRHWAEINVDVLREILTSLTAPVPDGKVCKRDELISFGKYLLSKERRDLIKFHPELEDKHFLQRYSSVSDADIANWKDNKLFKNP